MVSLAWCARLGWASECECVRGVPGDFGVGLAADCTFGLFSVAVWSDLSCSRCLQSLDLSSILVGRTSLSPEIAGLPLYIPNLCEFDKYRYRVIIPTTKHVGEIQTRSEIDVAVQQPKG
jgi:hypothetical protein